MKMLSAFRSRRRSGQIVLTPIQQLSAFISMRWQLKALAFVGFSCLFRQLNGHSGEYFRENREFCMPVSAFLP